MVVANRSRASAALAELVEELADRARALGLKPDEPAELLREAMA